MTADSVTAIATAATAIGVLIALAQYVSSARRATCAFEDEIQREYLHLSRTLPMDAYLGQSLSDEALQSALDSFFRYFLLCDVQALLRVQKRVSKRTWRLWSSGMQTNFNLPAFQQAWTVIQERSKCNHLRHLNRLISDGFSDPATWRGRHRALSGRERQALSMNPH